MADDELDLEKMLLEQASKLLKLLPAIALMRQKRGFRRATAALEAEQQQAQEDIDAEVWGHEMIGGTEGLTEILGKLEADLRPLALNQKRHVRWWWQRQMALSSALGSLFLTVSILRTVASSAGTTGHEVGRVVDLLDELTSYVKELAEHVGDLTKTGKDHEERLQKLEEKL